MSRDRGTLECSSSIDNLVVELKMNDQTVFLVITSSDGKEVKRVQVPGPAALRMAKAIISRERQRKASKPHSG